MVEINNTTKHRIPIKKTKDLVKKFFQFHKKKNWNISIAIVSDKVIKKLNKEYRQIDKTTDILSFRGGEFMGKYLGEIVINIDEIKRVDKYKDVFVNKPSVQHLFNFVLVHGLLHLIGYDDETEKDRKKMLELGTKFLDKIT